MDVGEFAPSQGRRQFLMSARGREGHAQTTSATFLGFWTPSPPLSHYQIHVTSLPLVRFWPFPVQSTCVTVNPHITSKGFVNRPRAPVSQEIIIMYDPTFMGRRDVAMLHAA